MAAGLRFLCLFAAFSLVWGDCYMHNPRGSNNRLNERSANRNNANRMFDSQNNNRGGYNAGDQNTAAFNQENQIYYMKYFQSGQTVDTNLLIEWTNQHGCGGNEDNDPHKLNCNIVIQYMVQDYDGNQGVSQALRFERLRNGRSTQTQNYQSGNLRETSTTYTNRRQNNVQIERGLHESFDYYDDCYTRTRNTGLFTADQRLRTNNFRTSSAIYTRQNPNGNRRGYECPEERDYYPYWHPSPWRDIAVLTDNQTLCSMYQNESFNVKPRQRCREFFDAGRTQPRPRSVFNNETGCTLAGGVWFTEYAYIDTEDASEQECQRRNNTNGYMRMWAPKDVNETSECLVLPQGPPACIQGGWTRVNHLGNGRDGVPLNFTWKIPYFPSGRPKLAVLRVRYNISTDDYHPWLTNSSFNDNPGRGIRSPIQQNPNVDIGSTTNKPLRLAINTAQFGRTFQDRSHVMVLRPRTGLPDAAQDCTIHNLNVRGKRGNIVQVYPSVEYDFVPNRLNIQQSECLHIQWTGSNTHNNGAPGGDGQTGDAGEGTGGTDRHNIVEIPEPNSNYPLPWTNSTLFKNVDALWTSWDLPLSQLDSADLAVAFASAGFYQCYRDKANCDNSVESPNGNTELQRLLNNAPASFEGALLRFRTAGTYHYICSRNNNFTNRSQKGQITVQASKK